MSLGRRAAEYESCGYSRGPFVAAPVQTGVPGWLSTRTGFTSHAVTVFLTFRNTVPYLRDQPFFCGQPVCGPHLSTFVPQWNVREAR